MAENLDIDIRNLPLGDVYPSKTNPRKRFDDTALAQMAESIKAKGVIQPIVVRINDKSGLEGYEIVAGESRWRASKLAGKETIPAVIRELSDLAALEIQVDENAHRKDLHPLEEARGFKQLLDKSNEGDLVGLTVEDLANKVNKGKTYVYGALKLLDMCLLAQDAFYDERIGELSQIESESLDTLPAAQAEEAKPANKFEQIKAKTLAKKAKAKGHNESANADVLKAAAAAAETSEVANV